MTTNVQVALLLLFLLVRAVFNELRNNADSQKNITFPSFFAPSTSSSPSQLSVLSPSSSPVFPSESPASVRSFTPSSPHDSLYSFSSSSSFAFSSSSSFFPLSRSFPISSSPFPFSSSFPSSSPSSSSFSFSPSTSSVSALLPSSSSYSPHVVPVHQHSLPTNALCAKCDLGPTQSSIRSSSPAGSSSPGHSHTQIPSAADSGVTGPLPLDSFSSVHLLGDSLPDESSQHSSSSRENSQHPSYSLHESNKPPTVSPYESTQHSSSSLQGSYEPPLTALHEISQPSSTSPTPGSAGNSDHSPRQSSDERVTYGSDEASDTGTIEHQGSAETPSPFATRDGAEGESGDWDLGMTGFQNGTQKAQRVSWCGVTDDDDNVDDKGEWKGYKNATGGGVAFRRKRYTLYDLHWEKKELTWKLRTRSRNPKVTENMVLRVMTDAFRVWSDASSLTFRRAREDEPDVDIYVDFHRGPHGDNWPFDRRGGTLAHAFYPTHGDIHFDDDENFVEHSRHKEAGVTSLFYTAVHELGHSLGLRHSDVEGALMAPYYQDLPSDFTLPDDDRYAIQAIYGPPTNRIPTVAPNTHPPPPTPPPTRPPIQPPTRPPTRTTRPPTRPTASSTRLPPPSKPFQPTPPQPQPQPPLPPEGESTCQRSSPPQGEKPDICSSDIDAATLYRHELWFFKGRYYWRLNTRDGFNLDGRYPRPIAQLFRSLPASMNRVDAAVETLDGKGVVFFSGNHFYWLGGRSGLNLIAQGTLQSLGLDPEVKKLDAAFKWGHNGRIYFVSGDQYWRFDTAKRFIADDYPRYIGVWQGLPPNVSAALTFRAATYFFEGNVFWRFNNLLMAVESPPSITATFWFNCPHIHREEVYNCTS